jgi:predicted alpha/beta-hydrolase family hydrolase
VKSPETQHLTLTVGNGRRVSGLYIMPPSARACFVLAHGAGAGMNHPFLETVSPELAAVGIGTLRYQFPYMEAGSRRPDPPALCHATVRAAADEAARRAPGLQLIAGGRSFGGRMTSQTQSQSPLPGVVGLVFLGFPLHPAKKPSGQRAEHLSAVKIPMLFLQGSRDELADMELLQALVDRLGPLATLHVVKNANHSFEVPARSGTTRAQVIAELVGATRNWLK